ncbi:MAG TPA: hypothetical protein VGJ96_02985 [Gemmatimonadaceae bacterium]
MRPSLIGAVLFVPAMLSAQAGASAKASTQAGVSATAPDPKASAEARAHANANAAFNVPERFSANGRAKLEGMFSAARQRELPEKPIADRVAEGEAKGASEADILAAAGRTQADMETTQEAMLAAGRARPSGEEISRGAMLMAHGATSAQIEAMARHTPSNRSLVVAFDVVSRLAAEGLPVTQALSRVQAKLDARASDATILSLAPAGTPGAAASASGLATAAAGGANASAQGNANAAAKGGLPGVAGGVAGTVTGVVKKP